MMGVNLSQWRYSIGMFNLKSVCKMKVKVNKSSPFLDQPFDILGFFAGSVPIQILIGLLKVLVFSFMVITFLFIFLMSYPFLKFLCDETLGICPYRICPFVAYFADIFIQITLIPGYISASFRSIFSLFKNQLSEKTKNILFFVFVLQIMLLISGTVKVNPGPHMSKKKI